MPRALRRFHKQPRFALFAFSLSYFCAGALVASFANYLLFAHQRVHAEELRQSDINAGSGYSFTDPLMGLDASDATSPDYQEAQASVSAYVAQAAGLSSDSITVRDIDADEGFAINPNELYDPASLSKIPLAMAYYDLAEDDSSVLSQTIFYPGTPDLDAQEQVRSAVQLMPRQAYTVQALIEHMIRYSDNNAEVLLADHLSSIGKLGLVTDLFANLGIKTNPLDPDYATADSYSTFLRVLYNATYLDRDHSEALLKLMSESDFTQGIESGVPNGIEVAQKFGDARVPDASGTVIGAELHNCGIVYYPQHPYTICVMTKGASVQQLEPIIAGISRIVFRDMENRYPIR